MTPLPSFDDFYRAVHGWEPFPWQSRLAELVAENGWPSQIGVPTGLGKTSAIDIAVWSLAAQADLAPHERTAPTRVWYVVNRRLLVDAASEHASRLADLVNTETVGPIGAVADRLRTVEGSITNRAMHVSRLRGGSTLESRPAHVAQPAIICATVPMFASRLLFRAYGSSNRVWPIDAALAGVDSLVLLDEAHLSGPLIRLLDDLPKADISHSGILRAPGGFNPGPGPQALTGSGRAYPRLVSLTATGQPATDRFDLDRDDFDHPIVARRLNASKPCTLLSVTDRNLAQTMASQIIATLKSDTSPTSVLAFVNRPVTARNVFKALESDLRQAKLHETTDVVVLTGQLRANDAERVRTRLLDPTIGLPSGGSTLRAKSLVVIATQTLEVGADLDATHIVTESAGVRALTQRFGRLNRLGHQLSPSATIVHPVDRESGLYGDEPDAVFERLQALEQPVDLCPAAIALHLGAPTDSTTDTPMLLPTHVWEWSKTSVPVTDAAPIDLFYDGFGQIDRSVSVLWRRRLGEVGSPLYPAAHQAEWVEAPVYEVREFLGSLDPDLFRRLSIDGGSLTSCNPDTLRIGDRIVVHVSAGGYSDAGWDPSSIAPVDDLSPWLSGSVHVTRGDLALLLGRELDDDETSWVNDLDVASELSSDEEQTICEQLFERLEGALFDRYGAAATLASLDRVGADAVPYLRWSAPVVIRSCASDALDELSIAPRAELDDHLRHVGQLAGRIANAAGIPEHIARTVELAGGLHDIGKADPRFQRWLGVQQPGPLMAKSNTSPGKWQQTRIAAGWPTGARHELLSVQLINSHEAAGHVYNDSGLLKHLVISHHGHGRPSVDTTPNGPVGANTIVHVDGHMMSAATDPSKTDWEQPERYRALTEEYGAWGLAYLETIVRQADHIVSKITEVQ